MDDRCFLKVISLLFLSEALAVENPILSTEKKRWVGAQTKGDIVGVFFRFLKEWDVALERIYVPNFS
jgi:hypothetical protein